MRINLELKDKQEWNRLFQERESTIFVASKKPPAIGTLVRLDVLVGEGGPKIIFRGNVVSRRLQGEKNLPKGCRISLGKDEREKIRYLNGYAKGGLDNLREARRIPVRLHVTYGGLEGSVDTYTRDINDDGVFVISESPLAEGFEIHLVIAFPDCPEPFTLAGEVVHTVVVDDEDVPGMGICFAHGEEGGKAFTAQLDKLEKALLSGKLDDEFLL